MNNNDMISIEDGFQYSINIAFDLHNEKKLSSFIPTKSSLQLIESVLLSTRKDSTDRARVLVGAYGKGKSHIVLSILSLLSGASIEKFSKMQKKIEGTKLEQLILNYQEEKTRLLPVLITGTGTSISQSFLLALQRTLSENDLLGLMPATNFKAAIKTIERWKNDYPATYEQFKIEIQEDINDFLNRLSDFDNTAYRKFEEVYPTLTSGGLFNPFLGFDVTEIYESVVKSLKDSNSGYNGLYVVYDEFSKYLESNISSASISDTKMLQDFAEKCNRSADNQLHLMLICHKEISNYIDNLPKQKVDGWRGISERFTHVHLNNNFTQTYEIIESVIIKNPETYKSFISARQTEINILSEIYSEDSAYNDLSKEELEKVITGCYPLHPVSTFILPRLSERVAQNERTLFTFLSSPGNGGLPMFLEKLKVENKDKYFNLLTPDVIYDYFAPLFQKEVYTEDLYKTYTLTSILLAKLDANSLEAKLIKTISLIYILSQFEKLAPTSTTLHHAFINSYSLREINLALENLVEKECIVYLKRSNNFYSLKQSSGIDINEKIQKTIQNRNSHFVIKNVLNNCNFDKALYPLRYNDEKEMTRYFSFSFIDSEEIDETINWNTRASLSNADGLVYAILPKENDDNLAIINLLKATSSTSGRCLFILPNQLTESHKKILAYTKEYDAVQTLLDSVGDDTILHDEYEVILSDLQEIIMDFISLYTQSEKGKSTYIYKGNVLAIKRKADVTEMLSKICDTYYSNTPVIINEAVNKNEISVAAKNARNKIVSALLRNDLEKNLGLTGGQELSIMRSVLCKPGVISVDEESPQINFNCNDKNLSTVFELMKSFIFSSKNEDNKNFESLYIDLMSEKNKIGMRKGLIPLYLACLFHEYRKQISIYHGMNEIAINADSVNAINDNPESFTIKFMDWSTQEDEYIENIESLFKNYIWQNEKSLNSYDFIFNAIRRWYMELPKYVKEMKKDFNGVDVPKEYSGLLKSIKNTTNVKSFVFTKLKSFNSVDELAKAKTFFDNAMNKAILIYKYKVCDIFEESENLSCAVNKWSLTLKQSVSEKIYSNGLSAFLKLCKSAQGNSEEDFYIAKQLAFISTDLNIEDWNDSTLVKSLETIKELKIIAEKESSNTKTESNEEESIDSNVYELSFVDLEGLKKSKRFEKVEKSSRANLLSRAIRSNLESMGMAVTESEKRQVLMEVLLELCGEN